ncbi:MAG: hypothetical protein PWR03_426 [Tenuifilum sp.]|jgi:benzil reductase ((S)-benzoin forming)|uniref:SDR family NAD(P)-dependent oxidoreductase n=1 Tax=Tenuifilum sp. TaxID=2760880 RepID=UPI0024AA6580|nr:SDR family NAD(P)-dependent oxidoreductase [Tenuifilum sp.]MDI3526243.1 hypothetical protein [Tenuifilum sp.]
MRYFYITGTSSGIGFELANFILKDESSFVIGYARRNNIEHQRYKHIKADFSSSIESRKVEIPFFEDAEQVVLINNAGILGDVNPVGEIDNEMLEATFVVNAITPAILSNRILSIYKGRPVGIAIVNISSGAARHAVESWAGYCASKAALDMFSLVLDAEQSSSGSGKVKVLSIAPGVVDTAMQDEVRKVEKSRFPQAERFHKYKREGILSSATDVAKKIVELIDNPPNDPIIDLRLI